MPKHHAVEKTRDGFSPLCPEAEEVKAVLVPLGLTLTRHIPASYYTYHATLPHQYHFSDSRGLEVIYLAGKDTPEEGGSFPAHASRWWIICGADEVAFRRVSNELSARYALSDAYEADDDIDLGMRSA